MAVSNEFYLRRLHSLTGILMGGFLFNHFLTNSFIYFGRESFNHKVHIIHSIPGIVLLEIALIALPFLFHGLYGLYLLRDSAPNTRHYNHGRNWMYTLQRVTAVFLAAFVTWHVIELRFYVNWLVDHYTKETHEFILGASFYDYLVMKFESPLFRAGYYIGVASAIIHWSNGLCTFCMSWGISVGPRSQKMIAGAAVGVALLYTAMIGASIYALQNPPDAPQALEGVHPITGQPWHMYPTDAVSGGGHVAVPSGAGTQVVLVDPAATPSKGLLF